MDNQSNSAPANKQKEFAVAALADKERYQPPPGMPENLLTIEPVMKVSLSADHRVIDGAEAARFFQAFRNALESPGWLAESG